jgi:hypothetical protein
VRYVRDRHTEREREREREKGELWAVYEKHQPLLPPPAALDCRG